MIASTVFFIVFIDKTQAMYKLEEAQATRRERWIESWCHGRCRIGKRQTSRSAREGIEGVDDGDDDVMQKCKLHGFFLTWRPARAEWLCCFFWPSVADVFPPELLPPEDLPFPPAIVMMFVFLC